MTKGTAAAARGLIVAMALATAIGSSGTYAAEANRSLLSEEYETCGAIKGKMELLFHEARALCQPAPDDGKIGIVLASPLPVFRLFETKRAFFIAAVLSVGYVTRRAGLADFGSLYVLDSDSIKTLDGYAIPVSRAATLQQQGHDGQITGDAYVSAVMQELRPMKIPAGLYGGK
jgi:hypothetical protein